MSYRRIQSVLLRWVPSLNIRSKLKGQCTDVKSGCVTLVRPSLSPHSLSWKQKSCATVPLSYRRCQYTHTLFSCKMGIVLNRLWCYIQIVFRISTSLSLIIRRETISYVQLQSFFIWKVKNAPPENMNIENIWFSFCVKYYYYLAINHN